MRNSPHNQPNSLSMAPLPQPNRVQKGPRRPGRGLAPDVAARNRREEGRPNPDGRRPRDAPAETQPQRAAAHAALCGGCRDEPDANDVAADPALLDRLDRRVQDASVDAADPHGVAGRLQAGETPPQFEPRPRG